MIFRLSPLLMSSWQMVQYLFPKAWHKIVRLIGDAVDVWAKGFFGFNPYLLRTNLWPWRNILKIKKFDQNGPGNFFLFFNIY
jgi:hypothetical protein